MSVVKMTSISSRSIFFSKITLNIKRYYAVFGKLNASINIRRAYSSVINSQNIKPRSCTKAIHLGCPNYSKLHMEVENSHAHTLMEKNSLYASALCKPLEVKVELSYNNLKSMLLQDWSCRSASEIFGAYRDVSFLSKDYSLELTDPLLKDLCDAVAVKCIEFEDSQLLTTLQCLSLWPPTTSIKIGQFFALWGALDKVCVNRLKDWNADMGLLVVDHWYLLNLARASEYVKLCLKKLSRKLNRLTPQQFVQLMFFINLRRKLPSSASQFELTYTLENLCEKLSLEELSIVAMGFFKSQTSIRNPHVGEVLLSRLESSFRVGDSPPDSITLASLLKILRSCVHPSLEVLMYNTLDAMQPHIKNISLLGCLHVALMGTNIQLFHESVTNAVCERYVSEMKNARLKDIERLAFLLSLYNHDPRTEPCIYETMLAEIRRRMAEGEEEGRGWAEVQMHGECLVRFLAYLSIRGIFPLDLIEKVLNPDFITHVYGKSRDKVGREVLILDANLEVQCPHYQKNRLDPKLRAFLSKKFKLSFSKMIEGRKLSAANRLYVEVLETIKSFHGAEGKVTVQQILPQFERPDIVICIEGSEVFRESKLPKRNNDVVQKCPSNCGQWHAVVAAGRNSFMRPSNQPLGLLASKMIQLTTLGYKPTLIPWFEWDTIRTEERPDYLRRKLFN